MRVALNVAVSEWRAPDFGVALAGGPHELPSEDVKLTSPLVRCIAAAAAAGAVEITDADAQAAKIIGGAVESDDDSLAVYEEAVASGVWLDGHLQQVIAEREQQLERLADELKDDSLDEEEAAALEERVAFSERLLEEAKTRLAHHRGEA